MLHFQFIENETFQTLPEEMFHGESNRKPDYPIEASGKMTWSVRSLLARIGGRTFLVDTGFGTKLPENIQRAYTLKRHIDSIHYPSNKTFSDSITDVLLTHLHLDHAGGNTFIGTNGEILPSFPMARYWCSREQYEYALSPEQADRDSYFPNDFEALRSMNRLFFLEEGFSAEGIRWESFIGHSPGMVMYYFEGAKDRLCFAGDLLPSAAHCDVNLGMIYDFDREQALKEKETLLEQLAATGSWVALQHDAYRLFGQIDKKKDEFIWRENPSFLAQKILR